MCWLSVSLFTPSPSGSQPRPCVAAVETVAASALPHRWNVVINCPGIVVLSGPRWYVDNTLSTSPLLVWWPRAHAVVYGCRVCVSRHCIYRRLWVLKSTSLQACIHPSRRNDCVNRTLYIHSLIDYLRKFSEAKMCWQQRIDVWGYYKKGWEQ